jgi:hypothetical protein
MILKTCQYMISENCTLDILDRYANHTLQAMISSAHNLRSVLGSAHLKARMIAYPRVIIICIHRQDADLEQEAQLTKVANIEAGIPFFKKSEAPINR